MTHRQYCNAAVRLVCVLAGPSRLCCAMLCLHTDSARPQPRLAHTTGGATSVRCTCSLATPIRADAIPSLKVQSAWQVSVGPEKGQEQLFAIAY